ncbi:MAG: sigma-70 region 4 domain-containing protein, partial [Bacteroidetes bacterium]|nr:sigma-70 region 4 domain-containing protein [Bacteroidota bacterium]
ADEPVWSGDQPDALMEQQDRTAAVAALLNALYPTYREVIVLREYDQLSYDEIAAVTGTSVASVKSRLFKARRAMLDRLSELYPEGSL